MKVASYFLLVTVSYAFVESSPECPSGVAVTWLPQGNDATTVRGSSGPPGKRGATGSPGQRGEKGERGEPGSQAECSEQCINTLATLERKMEEMKANFTAQLERLRYSGGVEDCNDVSQRGFSQNGIYPISINGKRVNVYCDFETEGGNWLVFQRRESGNVDFYRNWIDYKKGFGDVGEEFWLGLEHLHDLTSSRSYELRIDLEDFNGNRHYASYSSFSIEDSSDNYRLRLGTYSGDAGDSLTYHENYAFTTKDQDNDNVSYNCAVKKRGAWWYNRCHASNLNGLYIPRGESASSCKGIRWQRFPGLSPCNSLKRTEMKIRTT